MTNRKSKMVHIPKECNIEVVESFYWENRLMRRTRIKNNTRSLRLKCKRKK